MTDIELIELAAEAVGLNVKAHRVDSDDKFTHLIIGKKNTTERVLWNPLTDDRDAFQLALKLNMSVSIHGNLCIARTRLGVVQTARDLPTAEATRRAIVRAAAEIGKQVKE